MNFQSAGRYYYFSDGAQNIKKKKSKGPGGIMPSNQQWVA